MMYILILCLVVGLLIADAVIFFLVGYATAGYKTIKSLKEKGWTINPPDGDEGNLWTL